MNIRAVPLDTLRLQSTSTEEVEMYTTIALFLGALCAQTPAFAAPDLPSASAIMRGMKAALEPDRGFVRRVRITTSDGAGSRSIEAAQAYDTGGEHRRLLTVIRAPQDFRGNAVLIAERRRPESTMWVYVPEFRRVREIAGIDAYEQFLGTTFTLADIDLVHLHERYRVLRRDRFEGRDAYAVEERAPGLRGYYSRIVNWVDAETRLPIERRFYDAGGRLWKVETFRDLTVIDGVPTPITIVMEDVQAHTQSRMQLEDINYAAKLPVRLFDPAALGVVAADPTWDDVLLPGSLAAAP
ncbi:MAG: outer membrane lipoprotein-sorting protein [Gammaproteobacteria bacterium]|nr:outer membrane lipoprotein-sorting protein [Gammaproteobacteria bacterium]